MTKSENKVNFLKSYRASLIGLGFGLTLGFFLACISMFGLIFGDNPTNSALGFLFFPLVISGYDDMSFFSTFMLIYGFIFALIGFIADKKRKNWINKII